MTETGQTKKRGRLYVLMPMAPLHNLGRNQTGQWATSDAADTYNENS